MMLLHILRVVGQKLANSKQSIFKWFQLELEKISSSLVVVEIWWHRTNIQKFGAWVRFCQLVIQYDSYHMTHTLWILLSLDFVTRRKKIKYNFSINGTNQYLEHSKYTTLNQSWATGICLLLSLFNKKKNDEAFSFEIKGLNRINLPSSRS